MEKYQINWEPSKKEKDRLAKRKPVVENYQWEKIELPPADDPRWKLPARSPRKE